MCRCQLQRALEVRQGGCVAARSLRVLATAHLRSASEPSLSARLQLLEDLDAFACNVAHAHCDDGDPNTRPIQLVTACVDSVEVHQAVEPLIDHDLELEVGPGAQ